MDDLHSALQKHLPPDLAKEAHRMLYGNPCRFI